MADNELIIKINGSAKQFNEELDKVKKKTEDLDDSLTSIAKVSGLAFATLVGGIGLSVKAFADSEKSSNALTQSLKNQGIFSQELLKDYKNQADALEDLTGVDDDSIVKGEALIQGYLGQTKVTKELTKSVLDLAAGTGMDLEQAFTVVGKSIGTSTNALARQGIVVDEHATKEEKLASVVQQLSSRYQDQAEAANQANKGVNGLLNVIGDFSKKLGAEFAPFVEAAASKLAAFIKVFEQNPILIKFIAVLGAAAISVTGFITIVASVGLAFTALGPIIAATGTVLAGFGLTLTAVLGPIALVVAALGGLGAALILSTKNTDLQKKSTVELFEHLGELKDKLKTLEKVSVFGSDQTKNMETVRKEIVLTEKAIDDLTVGQYKNAKAARDKASAEEDSAKRTIAANKAAAEVTLLETSGASRELIELKQKEAELLKKIEDDKYKTLRPALQKNLEQNLAFQADAEAKSLQQQKTLDGLQTDQNKIVIEKNKQALLDSIETEQSVKEMAALVSLKEDIKFQNTLLANREKFGKLIGSVATVINFKAVLEFAQTGLAAVNQLAEFPNKIKSASEEALKQEDKLKSARTQDIESRFKASQQEIQTSLERGQIDEKEAKRRLEYIQDDRSNALASLQVENDARLKNIDEQTKAQETSLKAQQAASTVLSTGLGKLVDSYLPGLGSFASELISLASKGVDQVKAAFAALAAGFQTVIVTIIQSIGAVLEGIGALLGPLLIAIFEQLGPFLENVLSSLGVAVGDIIVGLLDSMLTFFTNFDVLFDQIIQGLVDGITSIVERAPEIINKLVELAPLIITKLYELMPQVAVSLTKALVENADTILLALGKAAIEGQANIYISAFEHIINGFADVINDVLPGDPVGHVNLGRVSLASGGVVSGGTPGQDSVPAMLMPGELVVPADQTATVLNSLYSQLGALQGQSRGASGGTVRVEIGFSSVEAERVLTARQVEARALGVFREA